MFVKSIALLAAAMLATAHPWGDPSLEVRDPVANTGCDNIGLAQQETDTAVANLKSYGNGKKLNYYSYDGDTVAFFCIWKTGPMLNGTAAANVLARVTEQCGPYQVRSGCLRVSAHYLVSR